MPRFKRKKNQYCAFVLFLCACVCVSNRQNDNKFACTVLPRHVSDFCLFIYYLLLNKHSFYCKNDLTTKFAYFDIF